MLHVSVLKDRQGPKQVASIGDKSLLCLMVIYAHIHFTIKFSIILRSKTMHLQAVFSPSHGSAPTST
jgi:hypothetical protein